MHRLCSPHLPADLRCMLHAVSLHSTALVAWVYNKKATRHFLFQVAAETCSRDRADIFHFESGRTKNSPSSVGAGRSGPWNLSSAGQSEVCTTASFSQLQYPPRCSNLRRTLIQRTLISPAAAIARCRFPLWAVMAGLESLNLHSQGA